MSNYNRDYWLNNTSIEANDYEAQVLHNDAYNKSGLAWNTYVAPMILTRMREEALDTGVDINNFPEFIQLVSPIQLGMFYSVANIGATMVENIKDDATREFINKWIEVIRDADDI